MAYPRQGPGYHRHKPDAKVALGATDRLKQTFANTVIGNPVSTAGTAQVSWTGTTTSPDAPSRAAGVKEQAKDDAGAARTGAKAAQKAVLGAIADHAEAQGQTRAATANTFAPPPQRSSLDALLYALEAAGTAADNGAVVLMRMLGSVTPNQTLPRGMRETLPAQVATAAGVEEKQIQQALAPVDNQRPVREADAAEMAAKEAGDTVDRAEGEAHGGGNTFVQAMEANDRHSRQILLKRALDSGGIDREALEALQIPPDQTDLTGSGKNGLTVAELRGILEKAGMHQYLDTPRPAADFAALLVARNPIVVAQAPRRSG